MVYYNKSIDAILKEFNTSEKGLSDTDAEECLRVYGLNTIKVIGEPLWRKIIEPFANVFILVLFVAAVISIFNNEKLDAVIIGFAIAISVIICYVQQFSTERIMRSLQKHTIQQVEVWRDGKITSLESSQLVPGDIIVLNEGDKVPADARLIVGSNVRIDEAMLTGESSPVAKNIDALSGEKEIYEQSNMLFQGSFVVAGIVTAVVISTGNKTEFGQLAALTKNDDVKSPVQRKIDKLISNIIITVGGLAIVTFGLAIFRGTEIAEALRFVIAFAVSIVPESLPVAIAVVLALGMRRMAAKKALVRTMRAIETIGVVTTIATDKTGTLTRNKLTVQETWQPSYVKTHLATIAYHAVNHNSGKSHDPLDIAMIEFSEAEEIIKMKGEPLASLPFDQSFSMSGNLWHHNNKYHLNIKGSPERVLAKSNLTWAQRQEAEAKLTKFASQGYRVIALATTILDNPIRTFADLHKKIVFEFVGFIAVADILRPEAKHAISSALNAGVTVRMITGDHFETAYHIGRNLGLVENRNQVFDSRQMHTMSDEELGKIIDNIRVFSRVIPENKYRILALLKKKNITAMTGDGVNDVPALANAHVGIAMGSGLQIAKDAGDIILLDDNFKSIIDAIHEGRIIFANIRHMLFYLLSTNAGEALTMIGALVIGLPIPILPVQILWINIVTDTPLALPLGLEPGEKDIMNHRPVQPKAPILSKYIIFRIVIIALCMAAISLILYAIFSSRYGHGYARTIVFSALVVMQWANGFSARSDYESVFSRIGVWNGKFYAGLSIAVTMQMLVLFGPMQGLLHIVTVAIGDLVSTGIIAFVIPIALVEAHKLIGRRLRRDT